MLTTAERLIIGPPSMSYTRGHTAKNSARVTPVGHLDGPGRRRIHFILSQRLPLVLPTDAAGASTLGAPWQGQEYVIGARSSSSARSAFARRSGSREQPILYSPLAVAR